MAITGEEGNMSTLLQILLILTSAAFIVYVLLMVRKERFLLGYVFIWILLGLLGLASALFPKAVFALSKLFGFETPSNFVFFVCTLLLITSSIVFASALSKHQEALKSLVQEVSMIQAIQNKFVSDALADSEYLKRDKPDCPANHKHQKLDSRD